MLKTFLSAAVVMAFAATSAMGGYVPGPLPASVFGGGTVPANNEQFKAVQKASKALSKLAAATAKCYSKGAKNVAKGKADGVASCVGTGDPLGDGALDKYARFVSRLDTLPDCYDLGPAIENGILVVGLVKSFQPGIYCSSPSGAFVDGAAGF
jgi:hypothetical protein